MSGAALETFNESTPPILTLSGNAYLVTGGRGFPDYYTAPYFSGSTAAYFGESPAAGYDASQFVFWDELHPTTHAQQVIAQQALATLLDYFSPSRGHATPPARVNALKGLVNASR